MNWREEEEKPGGRFLDSELQLAGPFQGRSGSGRPGRLPELCSALHFHRLLRPAHYPAEFRWQGGNNKQDFLKKGENLEHFSTS